jgi:hypothetical protein
MTCLFGCFHTPHTHTHTHTSCPPSHLPPSPDCGMLSSSSRGGEKERANEEEHPQSRMPQTQRSRDTAEEEAMGKRWARDGTHGLNFTAEWARRPSTCLDPPSTSPPHTHTHTHITPFRQRQDRQRQIDRHQRRINITHQQKARPTADAHTCPFPHFLICLFVPLCAYLRLVCLSLSLTLPPFAGPSVFPMELWTCPSKVCHSSLGMRHVRYPPP